MPPLCPEIIEHAEPKHRGYGLPCANCGAYYPADLMVCPICGSSERVPTNCRDAAATRRATANRVPTIHQRPQ